MKKILLSILTPALALGLSSCETTGDPNQGGLFGWSPTKAQQRIDHRQRTLEDIEYDTDRQYQRTDRLESEAAAAERRRDRAVGY